MLGTLVMSDDELREKLGEMLDLPGWRAGEHTIVDPGERDLGLAGNSPPPEAGNLALCAHA